MCVEARGPHELKNLPPSMHPAVTLLKHMRLHSVPIKDQEIMTEQELKRAILYGARSSVTKETTFVRTNLSKKAQAGHITLFHLQEVHHLPRIWVYPLAAIPQQGRKLRLIYDFTWSGLNKAVTKVAHKEAIRFGKALYRVID